LLLIHPTVSIMSSEMDQMADSTATEIPVAHENAFRRRDGIAPRRPVERICGQYVRDTSTRGMALGDEWQRTLTLLDAAERDVVEPPGGEVGGNTGVADDPAKERILPNTV
jgi:hypothetical protein